MPAVGAGYVVIINWSAEQIRQPPPPARHRGVRPRREIPLLAKSYISPATSPSLMSRVVIQPRQALLTVPDARTIRRHPMSASRVGVALAPCLHLVCDRSVCRSARDRSAASTPQRPPSVLARDGHRPALSRCRNADVVVQPPRLEGMERQSRRAPRRLSAPSWKPRPVAR